MKAAAVAEDACLRRLQEGGYFLKYSSQGTAAVLKRRIVVKGAKYAEEGQFWQVAVRL